MTEVEFICHKCLEKNSILLLESEAYELICEKCNSLVAKSMAVSGFIYALHNDSMPGLIKIGFTSRSVEERVAELNSSTSTPTPFNIAFYFASNNPARDEALAHEQFSIHRLNRNREFFSINMYNALSELRNLYEKKEVYLNAIHITDYSRLLTECNENIRIKVAQLRSLWTESREFYDVSQLLEYLVEEEKFNDVNNIINIFLTDNPHNEDALRFKNQLKDEIGCSNFKSNYLKSCSRIIAKEVIEIRNNWLSSEGVFENFFELINGLMSKNLFQQVYEISELFLTDLKIRLKTDINKDIKSRNQILEIKEIHSYCRKRIMSD